ncbi:DUF805 domain-containing protein [Asticcacaulis solisilvae]|uniref:DUF805 domain-containing protein n=1 Tax=Asticcacaulis solisilvae TaxID=1217274 RepID=UPI003FD76F39
MAGTPLVLRPLVRYADFQGRSRRLELFGFLIPVWVIVTALYGWLFYLIFSLFGKTGAAPGGDAVGQIVALAMITFVLGLALFIPTLAVQVRRLHDSNRSGWWLLLPMAASTIGQSVLYLFHADEMMQLSMNMTPAMQGAVQHGFDLSKVFEAELPLYALTLPYTMVPSAAAYLVLLVLFFWPGTRGDNRFGANPRAR